MRLKLRSLRSSICAQALVALFIVVNCAALPITVTTTNKWRVASSGIKSTKGEVFRCYYKSPSRVLVGFVRPLRNGRKTFTERSLSTVRAKAERSRIKKAQRVCNNIKFLAPETPKDCAVPAGFTAIVSESQLRRSLPNGKYFMCSDIDLAGVNLTVPPLGEKFNGIFDGNGKTISNFKLASPSSMVLGFARVIGRSGIIRNLTLKDAAVEGSAMIGIVAGLNSGRLVNVKANGRVVATLGLAGGLLGVSLGTGSLEKVSFDGSVSNANSFSGQAFGLRE